MASRADVIVVGLGAVGAASLFQLARRGVRVQGIDRFAPPHDLGSSHGESRITRQAIGEGEDYVPLALRAHALWREIEAESGEALMRTVGAVLIGSEDGAGAYPGKPDFFRRTLAAARRFAIAHEVLIAAECRARWPALAPHDGESVYFEPGAGLLLPERCVSAQLALAARHGARIRTGETVISLAEVAGGVRVVTDRGAYEAGEAVVAAGAWTGPLLGGAWAERLEVLPQAMHWFEAVDPAAFAPERFPVFIWMHGPAPTDWFYGFPILDPASGMKIADEQFAVRAPSPETVERVAPEGAAPALYARHVPGRVQGLTGRPLGSRACLYTLAPESRFVIGRDPGRPRIIVAAACSGHGFKHSAAVGEGVARLVAEGRTPADLAPFAPETSPIFSSPDRR